ncbi:MAG: sulfur carrier protein ThiS [Oscillospiraceae bacterium]|nr:sulfur carrier protein ThiS [Oscillospiraceae bacterium]
MRVNGDEKSLNGVYTLKDFLAREGYDITRIAVEKNGVIIPKTSFESETLDENDRLEIVTFVGGG